MKAFLQQARDMGSRDDNPFVDIKPSVAQPGLVRKICGRFSLIYPTAEKREYPVGGCRRYRLRGLQQKLINGAIQRM